jgi:hypothetical protein
MSLQAVITAVLGCLLGCPLLGYGQATIAPATPPAPAEQHYPEEAYLSSTRYTNAYFGFEIDLPADARLEPVPQAVATDGRVQLLEVGGPPPADAEVSISAFPVRSKNLGAKVMLRRALDQELFRGVEELHGLSKTTLSGRQFYFYETRRGIDQHMLVATDVNGYVLIMQLGAHDSRIVKELESSFQQLVFFAPAQVKQYVKSDAQAYEGPAISSHRLAQLEADPPEGHINLGKFEGNVYHNTALGLTYQVPPGWITEAQGAVLPAIERARAKDPDVELFDLGSTATGAAERKLMKLCSRTLFSLWQSKPGADGQIPYDDFGEVTLSAIASECFPGVRFPASSTDAQALRDFLLQIGLTHPILREMRNAKAFTSDGVVFMVLRGIIGFKVPDDELSRRLSVAMVITQRRGYLLTWFFAAPHDSELQLLLAKRLEFDPEPKSTNAASMPAKEAVPRTKAAADVSSNGAPPPQPPSNSATSANLPGGGSTAESSPGSGSGDPQNGAASSSQQQSSASDTPQTAPPTLLRPGETMESQQGKGQPIPKH